MIRFLIESIRGEAERIDRIVRGLLDYALPTQTGLVPVHPGTVLTKVRQLLEAQGHFERVDTQWDIGGAGVPRVLMESHRLEHILVNLLLNGVHALEGVRDARLRVSLTAEDGEVTRLPSRRDSDPPGVNYMHRRRVSRDDPLQAVDPVFTSDRLAVIRVEDSGLGIPEADLDRIFDPFFTTKEPGTGTGLGLSICARLVEGMGGKIEARNVDPGPGALFIIRLPGMTVEHDNEAETVELRVEES